jgi:hypothetical protein
MMLESMNRQEEAKQAEQFPNRYKGDPPKFGKDLVIDKDSLVVDQNGVSWFVSPSARHIVHANSGKIYRE